MNWSIKFAYDEIENLYENHPWIIADDEFKTGPNNPNQQGESFISMQKELMLQLNSLRFVQLSA